jgi:hypothetical protein
VSRPDFQRSLDDAHARLEQDGAIELRLRSLDELLDAQPESGVERLAGVLVSARRLPDSVVVRIGVPRHSGSEDASEAAFRDDCRARAESAWRRVTTIRRAGLRQLAPSLLVATVLVAVAAGCGTLAQSTSTHVVAAVLYVVAAVSVIAAWVIAWMPIEEVLFDWRPDGRAASAYGLLARCRFEVAHHSFIRSSAADPCEGSRAMQSPG